METEKKNPIHSLVVFSYSEKSQIFRQMRRRCCFVFVILFFIFLQLPSNRQNTHFTLTLPVNRHDVSVCEVKTDHFRCGHRRPASNVRCQPWTSAAAAQDDVNISELNWARVCVCVTHSLDTDSDTDSGGSAAPQLKHLHQITYSVPRTNR